MDKVELKGGAPHHVGGGRRIHMGLDALSQGMEPLARRAPLAGQAGRGLAFGHTTKQKYKCGRSLPRLCEDRPRQQGIVAVAGPTTVGWKVALRTE
jgi:hypothetical protein